MSFELEVKAVAIRQAAEVYTYYEELRPGLGERFIAALVETYTTLRTIPHFQVRKTPYRYLKLRKFPYRVVFGVSGQRVIIYQVRHTRRKPQQKFGP
ncbi:MAG TPA: type II toxin-antitoxin system RelE/ParE family toxin [Flavobacteriales bacterium]|nr:type II toxin-antitoxin system RelE/ParE family toxin [Flavobacteriales bacterium]